MSRINRTGSTQSNNRLTRSKPREPATPDAVKRFNQAYGERGQEQQTERQLANEDHQLPATALASSLADGPDDGGALLSDSTVLQHEFAAMLAAQQLPLGAAEAAQVVAHSPAAGLADLLEKHVRQLLVSERGLGHRDGQVMLRLSDASLPGTDLLLSRRDGEWTLQAQSLSDDTLAALREYAPQLRKRFAQLKLGELRVEMRESPGGQSA